MLSFIFSTVFNHFHWECIVTFIIIYAFACFLRARERVQINNCQIARRYSCSRTLIIYSPISTFAFIYIFYGLEKREDKKRSMRLLILFNEARIARTYKL